MAKSRRLLMIILLAALSSRIVFILTLENRFYFPDSYQYSAMAENIISGKGFIISETCKAGRPPIYPLFLAACYVIFGKHLLIIRIIQALLSTLSCLIVYLIGKKIFNERVGLIATAITAIYPFFIFFSGLILSETLFILLLLIFIYLLISLEQQGSWWLAVLAGIINGLAILTRASLLLFILFLLPFWLIKNDAEKKLIYLGRNVLLYLIILALTVLTISPWTIRNYILFKEFIPVTTTGGQDLYEANSPGATGGIRGYTAHEQLIHQNPEIAQLSEVEQDATFRKAAFKWITNHPIEFIRLALVKFARFWNIVPNFDEYRSIKYTLVSLFSFGVVLGLALWELLRLRRYWTWWIILVTPILYFTMLHMVFIGSIRFRIPIEPYLILLAADNISFILTKLKPQIKTDKY